MEPLDHRNLGLQLDLYHIQEDAPGMVFWHPRGYAIYRVLEDYIRVKMRRIGYSEVRTPQLMPVSLWSRSGHWDQFRANMFGVDDGDGRLLALKPMSCPCHLELFNRRLRSWRALPTRYAEFGACHRNESSGSMHGLLRTRAFEQDDAHVICREEQVLDEVARFIGLLSDVYAELGFPSWQVSLATRPELRAGSDDLWSMAEQTLANAARAHGLVFDTKPGEGAFYGPKLEFALRDRQGRSWQCGTIQLDYVLPGRLGAVYVGPDGKNVVPIMIHHAVLGSLGRFIGILLEHHGMNLPFWLSPDQVAVAPVSREQTDYADNLLKALEAVGLRVTGLDADETLSRRILIARDAAIPVVAIVGKREAANGQVTLRERDGTQSTLAAAEAILALKTRR